MTTTTPFGATITPMQYDMQKIWKAIDELKPSDKAKITKGDNKLRALMAERNRPSQEEYRVAVNTYCTPRDAKIAEAQAKRDAIVKAANEEFEAARNEAMDEVKDILTEAHNKDHAVWKTNYELYKQEWYQLVVSVIGREIL